MILIGYFCIFYLIWMLFEFWGKSWINYVVPNPYISQLMKSGLIKNLVWTVPAIILIRRFENEGIYISLKEMFFTKIKLIDYIPIFILFTIYILISDYVIEGKITINPDFGWNEIIIVIFVGLTEEIVFRGFLLNCMLNEERKWSSIIINALLFLSIHFPKWIAEGTIVSILLSFSFVSVLVLSVIFSWTFIKSRNIWIPICLHMYWDLLIFGLMK